VDAEVFRVTVLLADVVRVAEGKLDCLGSGWQIHNLGANIGLGIMIEVPWSQTNRRHDFRVVLEDGDGNPVSVRGPDGNLQPFTIEGQMEVGRPPGTPAGTPIMMVPPPVNFGPGSLQLQPGGRYTFTVFINRETMPEWHRSFGVQHSPMQLAS
jgi:hypothetical protein